MTGSMRQSESEKFNYNDLTYRTARDAAFRQTNGLCILCQKKRATVAHHWKIKYNLPEDTLPEHLLPVCDKCHSICHVIRDGKGYSNLNSVGRSVPYDEGITTGFNAIDKVLGKLKEYEMIKIEAIDGMDRTGLGFGLDTLFALDIAYNSKTHFAHFILPDAMSHTFPRYGVRTPSETPSAEGMTPQIYSCDSFSGLWKERARELLVGTVKLMIVEGVSSLEDIFCVRKVSRVWPVTSVITLSHGFERALSKSEFEFVRGRPNSLSDVVLSVYDPELMNISVTSGFPEDFVYEGGGG